MDAKKKHKEISPKNQVISLLENGEYIKNPLVYSQLRGNMSLIQMNIYVAVASAMQDRINNGLANRHEGETVEIFNDDEKKKELFSFTIPLSSLNLSAKDYDQVEDTCRKMVERSFTYRWKDDDGIMHTDISSIFTKISIPSEVSANGYERRVGNIEVEMKMAIARQLFSLNTGYITHLADIVPKCKNAKTPKIYIFLCRLNSSLMKGVGEVDYNELKEYLGVLTYTSEKRDKIAKDSYTMYSYFRRDVLEPIREELERLAIHGDVEFSFKYTPIYPEGKKRGTPNGIRFELLPPVRTDAVKSDTYITFDSKPDTGGGLRAYVSALKMAWEGDETKRAEYPNWKRDFPKYVDRLAELNL